MKKKIVTLGLVLAMAFGCSMTAMAAPAKMADGTIFDAEYYAHTYADVPAVVGNTPQALYAHYTSSGKAEGRNPYDPAADTAEFAYLRNPNTKGEQNALKEAKSYLRYSAFSKNGLIHQLESRYGSGYTHEEAVYAVMNCGANWFDQALAEAQSYLSHMAFSKNGLTRQLESEHGSQFTHEQAVYAVNNCGANWMEQAEKSAASYLRFSAFSKSGLIRQLESEHGEGFTHEEAVHGAAAVGY